MRQLMYASLFGLSIFLIVPISVIAQIVPTTASVEITLSQESPGAQQEIVATVNGFGVALQTASISWLVNGTVVQQGVGSTHLSFTTTSLGDSDILRVIVRTPQGNTFSATRVVRPTSVVLLWEGDTYTPPFYHGRALYTSGSRVRLEAQVTILTSNGTRLDPKKLVYIWKKNGIVITDVGGVGASGIVVPGPPFLGSDIFEVDVKSVDGAYSGSSAVKVDTVDPLVQLYMSDPLVGVHYYKSIGTNEHIAASEALVIQAAPYYVDAYTPNDANLTYTWRANGTQVFGSSDKPSLLSVQFSTTETLKTTIELAVSHVQHLLQSGKGTFTLSFEGSARNSFFGI